MATIFSNSQGGAWYDHGKSNIVPYKQNTAMVPAPAADPIEGTARRVGRMEQVGNTLRSRFSNMKMPSVGAFPKGTAATSLVLDSASNLPAITADDVGLGTKAKLAGTMALRAGGAALGTAAGTSAGALTSPVTGPVGPVAGGVVGGVAGYNAGDQAAGGFRALANKTNAALGGDPNYFTSVEEDLAAVGRDANGSKPMAAAPQQAQQNRPAINPNQPNMLPTKAPVDLRVAGLKDANDSSVKQYQTPGSGTKLFSDQATEATATKGFRGKGFVGTVGHAGTPEQIMAERERVAGINTRADQTNREIHALKMAEVHGGNAADYMPGGSRDGGEGERSADTDAEIRRGLRSNSVRARKVAADMYASKTAAEAQNNATQATLRAAGMKNAMSPLEQQKALAEIADKKASTAKTLAETAGMPAKQKFEQDKALSADAQTTQAQAAKNKTDYVSRMKDSFGGDAEEASRFVNAVDQTYAGLVRHLASPNKPESAKVLQRAGIDPSKAASLYASIKDGNGNLLDAYAPGNSLMPFIENGVNRAKKIGKDSWLWKNSERANAFDPYYFDEDATEIARNGLRGTFGLRSSADELHRLY